MTDSRNRLAWLLILGIGVFYSVLIIGILPSRSFYTGDAGVKYLQVHNLINNDWTGFSIGYPGEKIDPELRYSPFSLAHFYENDQKIYGIYSNLFTAITAIFYALLGYYGLYLIPALSTLGTMALTYRLSRDFSDKFSPLAPVIVGLATPMLLYSLDLWERSLAVFLSTLSLFFLLKGIHRPDTKVLFISGLVLGISVWVRLELIALIPACFLALIWVKQTRWFFPAFAFGAGLAALLIPVYIFDLSQNPYIAAANSTQYESQSALHSLVRAMDWVKSGDFTGLNEYAQQRFNSTRLVVPWSDVRWIAAIALILAGRAFLAFVPPSRRRVLLFGLAIGIALSIGYLVLRDIWHRYRWTPDSLVRSFPLVFFIMFLGTAPTMSANPRSAKLKIGKGYNVHLLLWIAIVYIVTICATTPGIATVGGDVQWGPKYLLPAYPLFIVLILHALQQYSYNKAPVGAVVQSVFLLLLTLTVAAQLLSIRHLQVNKLHYEKLIVATEQNQQDVIVTDLWWFPQVVSTVFYDKVLFLVKDDQDSSLVGLLPQLRRHGVESFTLVTTPASHQVMADDLLAAQWIEQDRRVEQIWLEVSFATYEYDASLDGSGTTR